MMTSIGMSGSWRVVFYFSAAVISTFFSILAAYDTIDHDANSHGIGSHRLPLVPNVSPNKWHFGFLFGVAMIR